MAPATPALRQNGLAYGQTRAPHPAAVTGPAYQQSQTGLKPPCNNTNQAQRLNKGDSRCQQP
jgi:hypothetical protein